jgi:hypothetical protein
MAKFTNLSNEIYLLIIEELSDIDLFRFKSLNRAFLDAWLTFSWEEVEVSLEPGEDSEANLLLLERIS